MAFSGQTASQTPQNVQESDAHFGSTPPLTPKSFSSALRQLLWQPVKPNLNLCGSLRPP